MDKLGEYQQRYRDDLIKRAGIKPKSDDIPTITRAEAESRGMQPIDIPTITRAEATRIGLKPLGSNTQDEAPHIWKHDMKPKQPDHTITDRLKEVGQGVASGLGSIPDGANKIVGAPVAHLAGYAADGISKVASATGFDNVADSVDNFAQGAHELGDKYRNSNVAGDLSSAEILDTGKEPDNLSSTFKAVGDVGSTVVPFTAGSKVLNATNQIYNSASVVAKNGGKLAAPWLNNLNKFLGGTKLKDVGTFAAMGAGGELAKSENPNTSAIENSAREMAGGIFAGITIPAFTSKVAKGSASILTDPSKYPKEIVKYFSEYGENSFVRKYKGDLNTEVVNSANKLDLPLTSDLITNNPDTKMLMRNELDSYFADKVFKDTIDSISPTIVKRLDDKILFNIGKKAESSTTESQAIKASELAEKAISDNFSQWQNKSRELYDKADTLAIGETITPSKTIDNIKNHLSKLKLGSKAADSEKGIVKNKLEEFILDVEKGSDIKNLLAWERDLADIGAGQLSYKAMLRGIGKDLEKEIISSNKNNAEFIEARKVAANFNKQYIQEIKKNNKITIVRDLIQGKIPKTAIDSMKDRVGVLEMEKFIPNNPELMGTLKRTAFSKYLESKNIINSDGGLSIANFKKLMSEKEKDYVVSLVGKDNYKTLKNDFLPYIERLHNVTGKDINFSRTSYTTRDLNLVDNKKALNPKNIAINAFGGAAAGTLLGPIGAVRGLSTGVGGLVFKSGRANLQIRAIKNLSKMAVNKNMLDKLIAASSKHPVKKIKNSNESATLKNNSVVAKQLLLMEDPLLRKEYYND